MREQPTKASASLPPRHPLYAPGLRRRPRKDGEARYWLPLQSDIAKGWPKKSIVIPPTATEAECAELCRQYSSEIMAWRCHNEGPSRYSIAWLVHRYTHDEFSPYRKLKFTTRKNYDQDIAIIERTIGLRRIDPEGGRPRITGEDVWRWHRAWGKPDKDGNITAPSRARHTITMFRILIKYAKVIAIPGAADLCGVLEDMEFPAGQAGTVAPTRAQVSAFADKAVEMGYPSIAIATLAQFELTERRISIIGWWEGPQWRPGWTWQGISPDWWVRYSQNKVGVVAREFDLKETPQLLDLLKRIPEDRRIGPVICCETTGQPWKEKHFTDTWREIARAAGLPDELCSMHMRAGGATEADALGDLIPERHLKDAGGWSSDVVNRYRRNKQRNAQNVVRLRQENARSGRSTD